MARVFVSHRGVYAAPAKLLAGELSVAGHDVWLDVGEIDVGDSIVERIDAVFASADVLVSYLSADGDSVHITWMGRERAPTLARQIAGHGVTLLSVELTGGRLPAILADIKAADLVTDRPAGIGERPRAIDRHAATS